MPLERKTVFSADRVYRYTLWRDTGIDRNWFPLECNHGFDACPTCDKDASFSGNARKFVQFIGLNPSTADETKDDATIRRCCGYARDWGFGALCMTNLFAYRATDPKRMKDYALPIGVGNIEWLVRVGKEAGLTVCAWGRDGEFNRQATIVSAILKEEGISLHCLVKCNDGSPHHPLRLSKALKPIPWP